MPPLCWQNLIHVGTLVAALSGLLLGLHTMERWSARFVSHRLGWRAVLLTGWIGVPVHELGHLVTSLIFRHKIVDFQLFSPDPSSGTLGYVRHSCDRNSAWQRLGQPVIALAPLASGAAVLTGLTLWALPWDQATRLAGEAVTLGDAQSVEGLGRGLWRVSVALLAALWDRRTPWLVLQLYLAVSVAAHICPSTTDFKGALPGLSLLALLAACCAALLGVLGISLAGVLVLLLPLLLLCAITALLLGAYSALVGLLASSTIQK